MWAGVTMRSLPRGNLDVHRPLRDLPRVTGLWSFGSPTRQHRPAIPWLWTRVLTGSESNPSGEDHDAARCSVHDRPVRGGTLLPRILAHPPLADAGHRSR